MLYFEKKFVIRIVEVLAFGNKIAKIDTACAKSMGNLCLRSPHKTGFAGTPSKMEKGKDGDCRESVDRPSTSRSATRSQMVDTAPLNQQATCASALPTATRYCGDPRRRIIVKIQKKHNNICIYQKFLLFLQPDLYLTDYAHTYRPFI